MNRITADAFAAASRRRGFNVDKPAKEQLEAQLRETLERLRAGESLSALSRSDGTAPLAVALERPLLEVEALQVLASHQYLEHCLAAAEDQIAAAKKSAEHHRESADLWGKACADMGRAFDEIATAAGNVVLGQEPQRLAMVVRELLAGRMPEGTIAFGDETMARAFLRVAAERRAQDEKWGSKSMVVTRRPLWDPKHALAVLLEEAGEVARAILDDEGDERLLAELVQVAAVAVVWIQLLLRIQGQSTTGAGAAAEAPPVQDDAIAHETGHGSAGCRPSEHAAAGGAGNSGAGARDASLQGPTGLPRDATTSALVAASHELHEHRLAAQTLAAVVGEPGLDEDPQKLAARVVEYIEQLRAGLAIGDEAVAALCHAAALPAEERS